MTLVQALLALAICLVSLISAIAFLTTARNSGALPALIAWVTISAAGFYVSLCVALVTFLRLNEKSQVKHQRGKSGYSIETDSDAGEPAVRSAGTFHWESESFRAVNGLDLAPRSPETVLHYPLRSSFLRLPAFEFNHLFSSPGDTSPWCDLYFETPSRSPLFGPQTPIMTERASATKVVAVGKAREIEITGNDKAREVFICKDKNKALPPSPPISPIPSPSSPSEPEVFPFEDIEEAVIEEACAVRVVAMGKAKIVEIGPAPKGKGKMIGRVDLTRKARELTRKVLEGMGRVRGEQG